MARSTPRAGVPVGAVASASEPPLRRVPLRLKTFLGKRAESPCPSRQKGGLGALAVAERGARGGGVPEAETQEGGPGDKLLAGALKSHI